MEGGVDCFEMLVANVFVEVSHFGKCLVTDSELRADFEGLQLAWTKGLRSVMVECDSSCMAVLIQGNDVPLHSLVTTSQQLLPSN